MSLKEIIYRRRTTSILTKIYANQINALQEKDGKWMLYNT